MILVSRQQIATVGWALFFILLIGVACQHHPIFNPCTSASLFLLVLGWWCIICAFQSLDDDSTLFTPKNALLFVWFCKLVVIPIQLILVGNQIPFGESIHNITLECSILLTSFLCFAIGWHYNPFCTTSSTWTPIFRPLRFASLFSIIGLCSIVLFYGSLSNYWSGAMFTYTTYDALENAQGSWLGFLSNIGQRFGFWGILLGWYSYKNQQNRRLTWWEHSLFFLLACSLTLSSNRANMFFPAIAFASVIIVFYRPPFRAFNYLIGLGLIFLLLFFGHLRVQPTLDSSQVAVLFDHYTDSDNNYIEYASQLYLGSPYQISPLLSLKNPPFTLIASLLEPLPVIGKAYREESGPFLYNSLIENLQAQDKVIPVAGELYLNGGLLLLAVGYYAIGTIFRWFDQLFKKYRHANPPLAAAYFYLSMLFAATLLLSLTVLSQFLLYNAAPALLIITINWWQMRKGSST